MSICVSAVIRHKWPTFSNSVIAEIARAISPENVLQKWLRHPQLKSPEEEFTSENSVTFFLPDDFTIRFARRVMNLEHTDRWSAFLMSQEARQHFLGVSNRVAHHAGASEILFLPEGTVLEDSLSDDIDFNEIKRRARNEFGPPDLDVSKIYTEDVIRRMVGTRVHYFIILVAARSRRDMRAELGEDVGI